MIQNYYQFYKIDNNINYILYIIMVETIPTTYVLIDISYYIFYRYYALINWWKFAQPDDPLGDPIENKEFVAKYKKTFINKLWNIPKKLKIKNYKIIAAADCPRLDIWRHKIFDRYKENRVYDDQFLGGPFFDLGFKILKDLNIMILEHPRLEGDDCIALTTHHLQSKEIPPQIVIIANDMDYLQLAASNIRLINLNFKTLTDSKKWSGDPQQDLFCKIVMGDKSDDIPSVFKKCGPKTALKYYENKALFEDQLKRENAHERYQQNKKLVDFNEIPEDLVESFAKNLKI
jgi:5'-3' exonuclease